MHHLATALAVVFVSILVPAATVAQEAGPPSELEAHLDGAVLAASGFEPGGDAVVFGVVRLAGGYVTRVLPLADRLEADAAGSIELELVPPELLPADEPADRALRTAVWMVIDPARGGYRVLAPEASRARERPFGVEALRRGPGGLLDRLGQELEGGHLLLVRPAGDARGAGGGDRGEGDGASEGDGEARESAGVWTLTLEDGSRLDLDGARDGSFEVAFASWRPVGSGEAAPEPPEEIQPGDLVFVVEPTTLEYSVLRFVGPEEASR